MPDDEALGSSLRNSLGMRRVELSLVLRCDERYGRMRRVTPAFLTFVEQLCAKCSPPLSVHIPEMEIKPETERKVNTGGERWVSKPKTKQA